MNDNFPNPKISIIVAISKNGAIGKNNELLWRIPGDMRRFKELTTGHPIIMGRKTYESIGKPLPNRTNIIITRDKNYSAPGCIVTNSLQEALEKAEEVETQPSPEATAGKESEIFIIGGGEIYKEGLKLTDKLYLTLIHEEKEGDIYFPDYPEFKKEISREERETENGLKYTWLELERG